MDQPTNDHPNYIFTDPNSQNPNSPRTRGHNYAPTPTASRLTQQSPVLANNVHQIPHSPHHTFHPMPGHELHRPQSPVMVAYGFGGQPSVESSYAPRDASNAVAYAYRPGTDPPVVGERGASYQPSWPPIPIPIQSHQSTYSGHEMSHSVWSDAIQSTNTGVSHHETAYDLSQQWNGDAQRSFNLPTSPQASYISYHGRESMTPVEAPWSPQRAGYQPLLRHDHPPPPTLNNDDHHHRDRELYSPQSTSSATPPANGLFGYFPEQDPARNITYREQGSGVDDAKNSEMLGLGARIDCSCGTTHMSSASPGCHALPSALGSDYTARNSDHNQPSTSTQVQVDGPSRIVQLSEDLEAHFPNQPALKKLALYILSQPWCLLNEEEPPINQSEPVVLLKFFKRTPKSRFEPFFDGRLRCHVVETNGDRCRHVTTRKDRAVGHARAHFGYKPFACAGKCGKSDCLERYTCSSFRNDHAGRKKNPKRPCTICQKLLTAQNLKRHMKQHTASPSQVTAFSPQGGETEARPSKRPKLSIFCRPFGKK